MFTKSIRWRLQLWLAFLLVCVLSGFGAAVNQLHRDNQFKQIDDELERRVVALSAAVRGGPSRGFGPGRPPFDGGGHRPDQGGEGRRPDFCGDGHRPDFDLDGGAHHPPPHGWPDSPPPFGGPGMRREIHLSAAVTNLFEEANASSFYFAIWSRDGDALERSTNAPMELPRPARADTLPHTRMREPFREAYHFTEMGDCVLAGRDITADLNGLRRFAWWLLTAGGTVLAFGLGGGWLLTSRAIRPVVEISAAASRISAGNLSERIKGADTDNELGRLAGVLNSTFARLEAAFAQQKQFTADASHELRTPLAVLISEAQTTLARERSPEEYRETIEACLVTAQQMRRLTESLLDLARVDAGHEPAPRVALDLAEQTRAGVERVRPLAAEQKLQLHCDLAATEAFTNPERLDQVITNLLTNAIHYNRPNGEIRVRVSAEPESAVLTVADTGRGIAEKDLPHIFERFYRADKSRSRADGHFGLGLAICKAIVEADGGRIEVASQPGVGTTFTVRLPKPPAGK